MTSPARGPAAAALIAVVFLALGCVSSIDLTRPELGEVERAALVDSDPARRLLDDLLERRALDPSLTALAPALLLTDLAPDGGEPVRLPDQEYLRALAREVSTDFAALAFARMIGADARSRAVQAAFDRFLRGGAERSAEILRRPRGFPYTVLFAPSWLYRSHPGTGASFETQRRLLDRLGLRNRVIPSGETDTVEQNATAIAEAIRQAGRAGERVILVSASKSGAEAAFALARMLEPWEARDVAAWVNIAGAVRGSPLADYALEAPVSWFGRSLFWWRGWNWAGVVSITTRVSHERLQGAQIPESITVVNVVPVPVSGSVGYAVYGGYLYLREHGPNDGVVLLADAVWPGGVNLVALGADHLLNPRHADAYMLALLRAVATATQLHDATPGVAVAGEEPSD